jgi:hypothetical protein
MPEITQDIDWTLSMDRGTQNRLIAVLNFFANGNAEYSGGEDGLRMSVKALNDWLVEGVAAKGELPSPEDVHRFQEDIQRFQDSINRPTDSNAKVLASCDEAVPDDGVSR